MSDERADLMIEMLRQIEGDLACIRTDLATQIAAADRMLSFRLTDTEH